MFPPINLRFLCFSDYYLYHSKVLTEIRPNPSRKIGQDMLLRELHVFAWPKNVFFSMIPNFGGHFLHEKLTFLRILKRFDNVLIEKSPNPRPFVLISSISENRFLGRLVSHFSDLIWERVCLVDDLVGWLYVRLAIWLVGCMVGWRSVWLVVCLVGDLVVWLVVCLVGDLVGWLVGCMFGWRSGWLVVCLVGDLVSWFYVWLAICCCCMFGWRSG